MIKSAIISECGKYRYQLSRVWNEHKMQALVIMLNPSTADSEVDDQTVRTLIYLLKALDYGGFTIVNLYAYRTKNPEILATVKHPIGPLYDYHFVSALKGANVAICAWGANKMALKRANDVLTYLKNSNITPMCFEITKDGYPRHPLRLPKGTELKVYRGHNS